jgi:hypothetical protein
MRLKFDQTGERQFENGTRYGILFPMNNSGVYQKGVAWNGLTKVTNKPEGAELTDIWADDIKYGGVRSAEKFGGTIEAYTYPPEFAACNGEKQIAQGVIMGQQKRDKFGFCYRTNIGNDISDEAGYKLHLIYGCSCSPSEMGYETMDDSPDPISMSWDFDTTPVDSGVVGSKPTSHIEINSMTADETKLAALEAILYGSDGEYTAVAEPSGNPSTKGYYERSGTEGSYVYTPSADTSVDSQKTYYEITGATDPRLPLPAEVISTMAVA